MSIAKSRTSVGKYHYYPFGMAMDGNWAASQGLGQKYLYNGKELVDDLGLNWYDYGARWYDASVGRFVSVDPLGETSPLFSVFHYAALNPISFIDLYGLSAARYSYNWQRERYEDEGGNEVSWNEVQASIAGETPTVNVISVSKTSDKIVNNSIKYLTEYLSEAKIGANINFIRSNDEFDISKMSSLDAVAVIGSEKSETVDYILKNLDKGYLSKWFKDELAEYLESPASVHPEKTDGYGLGGWSYVAAITVNAKGDRWGTITKNMGIKTFEEATAFIILHSMGHLSGIKHGYPYTDKGFMAGENGMLDYIAERGGNLIRVIQDTVNDNPDMMSRIYKRFSKKTK